MLTFLKQRPMKHKETLTQILDGEADPSEIMKSYLRASAQFALASIMEEEVESLCGRKHLQGNENPFRRAGSEKGIMYSEGKKKAIRRPRVRQQTESGEKEYGLLSYYFARQITNIEDEIIRSVEAGVSTRKQAKLNGDEALSKSSVSRIWAERGSEKLAELRERELDHENWIALMLDGVVLSSDVTGIVALGITEDGEKQILDFAIGATENLSVADELMSRICERGFTSSSPILAILDGSKALSKAVLKKFPDGIIQRCLVHKERNLRGYLSKKDHGECARLMNRLRKSEGKESADEAVDDLKSFLKSKNQVAYNSLLEAGDELTAFHSLEVPSTLNKTFLSTNIIENVMRNLRGHLGRVTRWRAETGQPELWLASGLLVAESGFRRVSGYSELSSLRTALLNTQKATV